MFDIAEQLFPNLLTLIVQLSATGVIFLIYRKYLHKPVIDLMDRKANEYHEEVLKAESLRNEHQKLQEKFKEEVNSQTSLLNQQKKAIQLELEKLRAEIIDETNQEALQIKAQALKNIELERINMIKEVEKHVVDVSAMMVEKVLEGYTFDEQQLLVSLEREVEKHHAKS